MVSAAAVLVSAILVVANSDKSDKVCPSKYPGYLISDGTEAIFQGCYHSAGSKSVLPKTPMVNFRQEIDWDLWTSHGSARAMVKKCGMVALARGAAYFGVEFYGECYYGDDPNFAQRKVTLDDDCETLCGLDVGGPSAMVVYKIEHWAPQCPTVNVGYNLDSTHWAWNRGCYSHTSSEPVFPMDSMANFRYNIDWYELADSGHAGSIVKRCGQVALKKGATFFGIELFGNCFYGSSPAIDGGELACKLDKCFWDVGKSKGLMLYKVVDFGWL